MSGEQLFNIYNICDHTLVCQALRQVIQSVMEVKHQTSGQVVITTKAHVHMNLTMVNSPHLQLLCHIWLHKVKCNLKLIRRQDKSATVAT